MSDTTAILKRFTELQKKLEKMNGRKQKRFHIMTDSKGGKIVEVGIYDGVKKKYALTDIRAYNAAEVLSEMEVMITAKK